MGSGNGENFGGTMMVARGDAAVRSKLPGSEFAHYLVIVEGTEPGKRAEVGADALVIGRAPDCDLLLRDTDVSRRHCEVALRYGEIVVTDLGSTNGTLADGRPVVGSAILSEGGLLQVGAHVLRLERRSRREFDQAQSLDQGIVRASHYVRSLLPAPITDGPVRTDWILLPSARLGGDAFGYHALDADTLALYLLDVAGHGVEAAMHAASVISVLRQGALPGADFRQPAQVLSRLAGMFPMESHGFLFFTMWYGIYRIGARTLDYCSAGHPPAILVSAARDQMLPLRTPNLAVGIDAHCEFSDASQPVAPGSTLHIFSDGVFEIVTPGGERWELDDFLPLLAAPPQPDLSEPERIYRAVRAAARDGPLDDDFSLLTAVLP